MSIFDPQAFLNATVDTPSVKRPPLPAQNPASPDGLYIGILSEPVPKQWSSKDQTKSGVKMDVSITVDVPAEVQQSHGLPPTVVLFDSIMLDQLPNGGIDNSPGKNRRMRVYREAVDMNKPGDAFAFRMLTGRPVKVKVDHELYNGEIQERVGNVLRA